jgi:tol-pal system protein YbgF
MHSVLPALAILVMVATGCATRGSVRQLQGQVGALQTEVSSLRSSHEQAARNSAQVTIQLNSLEGALRDLRATTQQAASEVGRLGTRLRATEDDIKALRAEMPPRSVAVVPPTPVPPPRVSPAPPAPAPVAPAPLTPTPGPTPSTPGPPSRPLRETSRRPAAPEVVYGAALATFRAREHGQAVLEFLDFMGRYPNHPLAVNAQYWIGEAYYAQRDYRQALLEFQKVLDMPRRPDGGKIPDALLKIGLCYANLRQAARAHQAWERVIRDHPQSEAAAHARNLLKERRAATRH